MTIKLTKEEITFLDKIDNEIAKYGKTSKKCPRCGNEIICIKLKNSYSICCKSEGCIRLDYRGF